MLYIPHPFRYCYKCGQFKPFSGFPKNRSKKDGLASECHECNRKHVRKWANEHPEQVAQGKRLYLQRHPDRRKQSVKDYCSSHSEQIRQHKQETYYADIEHNRQKRREYAQKRYRRSPELVRAKARVSMRKWRDRTPDWYRRNPDIWKTYYARRQARKHSLPDTFSADDWSQSLSYFNNCCAVCGRPAGLWHTLAADHWIPLSAPDCPGTVATNIVPLCHGENGCNNSKHNRDAAEWLTSKYGPRKAKRILKRIQNYFEWVKQQEC